MNYDSEILQVVVNCFYIFLVIITGDIALNIASKILNYASTMFSHLKFGARIKEENVNHKVRRDIW